MDNLTVTSLAKAKINLHLEVLDLLDSGYHSILTIFQSVNLADRLVVSLLPSNLTEILVKTENAVIDGENLCFKAAQLFLEKCQKKAKVEIVLEKNIPISAGLAGGSADAAAVLLSLNKLFNQPFSKKELSEMALSLGADVPFCLLGGTALAQGIGEKLTPIKYLGDYKVVLIKEYDKSSTGEMYRRLDQREAFKSSNEDIISILNSQGLTAAQKTFKNDFLSVSDNKENQTAIIERLKGLGAISAGLSGSGPTVFGLFEKIDQETINTLKTQYKNVFLCDTCKSGVEIIE